MHLHMNLLVHESKCTAFWHCWLSVRQGNCFIKIPWCLVHCTSTWTYWATCQRHSYLPRAATSVTSQVSYILCRSFLTTKFALAEQFPFEDRNLPCRACCEMHWCSIHNMWPSQRSLLSLRVLEMLCCLVLAPTSSFAILSFQEILSMLLCHLRWAVSSHFNNVVVSGHNSALIRRVDKMTDSYNHIYTLKHQSIDIFGDL